MTILSEITLAAFTLANSARILAYVPQILKAAQDTDGAKAVSYLTWSLFLVSNLTTAAYAEVNKGDLALTMVFLGNAVGCAAILGMAARQRARHRKSLNDTSGTVVMFQRRKVG